MAHKHQVTGIRIGTLFILTGILLGAFGAHGLKNALTPEQITSFETGVRYQIYHGLALLVLSQLKWFNFRTLSLLTTGTLFFSISIYLLTIDELINLNLSWIASITPLGGLTMIIGWLLFFINVKSEKSKN